MKWVGLILLVLAALSAGIFFLRRALRRRREREENRRRLREELGHVRQAVEQFEQTSVFDDQIRLLADITR
ncbi:MAG: hypothetical protein V3U28_06300, partial [Candidatus Acidoferrales bacterium]